MNRTETALFRSCPLCDASTSTPVFETIRRCTQCGLSFVNPLGNYRGENETEEYFLHEYLPLHQSNWANSLAERRAHLEMIRRYAALPLRPRLLDVGCALGFMLKEATAAGWHAVGVETSEFAAGYARDYSGCTVHTGTLQQIHFPSGSFDVLTLMDVIEHVPEPGSLMREIHRVLRPQGVLFLITPNFGSLFVRLYRSKAYGIGPDEHVTYFQPSTITYALEKSGFSNVVTSTKDFYAENLRRLRWGVYGGDLAQIKTIFSSKSSLGAVRGLVNRVLRHAPLGDKLIAFAQK